MSAKVNIAKCGLKASYFSCFALVSLLFTYLPAHLILSLKFSGKETLALIYTGMAMLGILAQPLWGQIADATQKSGRITRCCTLAGFLFYLGLPFCRTPVHFLLCMWPATMFLSALPSLLDTMVLTRFGVNHYGRIRLWGSIGFGSTALLFPIISSYIRPQNHSSLVIPGLLICALFYSVSVLFIGEEGRKSAGKIHKFSIFILLRSRAFLSLMAFTMLHWCAHTPYNVILDVHRHYMGLDVQTTGYAVALAVACEIIFIGTSGKWLTVMSPRHCLMLTAAVTTLRWALMTYPVNETYFIAIQVLQGVSFGVFFPASIACLTKIVPEEMRATGQTLFSMLTFSVGMTIGNLLTSILIDMPGKGFCAFGGATLIGILSLLISLTITEKKVKNAN